MLEKQKHNNLEFIFIDDGSNDNSLKILKTQSSLLDNVRIIHKDNGGVSSARNKGLDAATGEYVLFVDIDDKFSADYVKQLYQTIEQNQNIDMAICAYAEIDSKENILFQYSTPYSILNNINVVQEALIWHGITSALWNKIFSMNIIRKYKLCFDETLTIGEDLLFLVQYCIHMRKASLISDCLYYYVKNPDGAMLSIQSSQYFHTGWLSEWGSIQKTEKVLLESGIDGGIPLLVKKAKIADKLLNLMWRYNYHDVVLEKELVFALRHTVFYFLFDKNLKYSKKISMLFNATSPQICKCLKGICKKG